jgi:hypothetical protein
VANVTRWTFRCADGRGQGVFWSKDEALRARKDPEFRALCGPGAKLALYSTEVTNITPDIPEHFNVTIGQHISSRRQLHELQKRNGWQDYEKDSSARNRRGPPPLTTRQREGAREMARLGEERARTVFKDADEPVVVEAS